MIRPQPLALGLLLIATTLHAEPAPQNANAKARALFQEGVLLAQQGDLAAALRGFEAAYAVRPNYSVLYNIAQTQAALGHPVEAIDSFQRYLAEGGKQVPEKRRGEVQALISANQQRIGRLRIRGGGAAARVWLDGKELSADARSDVLLLAKGEHTIVFWNGSGGPESRSAALVSDDVVEIVVPEPPPPPPPPQPLTQLSVTCQVPGVEVEVVGLRTFKTPQAVPSQVPAGQLLVKFSRPGYPTLERRLFTAADELTTVDCEQEPLSPVPSQLAAQLNLALSPPDADVFVDGARYQGGALPEGPHRLRVFRDGYVPSERSIALTAGRTQLYQISLTPTARERARVDNERTRARTVALVLGSLGVAALATSAGVYAWSSSRYDDWEARRRNHTATANDAAQIQRADDAAVGLLIAGGMLTLGGVGVFFASP